MSQMVATFAPLLAFMLIPVWIPLIAMAGGAVADLVSPRKSAPSGRMARGTGGRHRAAHALAETD